MSLLFRQVELRNCCSLSACLSTNLLVGEQKDFEVYSCNVSPDGKRLATAAGDGHVRIWAVDAIVNAANAEYSDKPTALAHMSYHSGTIHTVRFSPNGKWLASGADDKIICIYHLDENQPAHLATFGELQMAWVCWRVLADRHSRIE